ncbi:prenyltransferase [Streptomyces dysideae]|uniref:Prenyltransferase n=1 Tax=Streptomyces dysideae TaxID=909626 RepID=A0A117S0L3_9ACTN|nr:prenyltransferase [Streptomyces dysideae]
MRLADLALLVRAPAALSVPGDVIAGATAAGRPLSARALGIVGSSVCRYWAGMALNDYADATVDAVERPDRPVPSGRVARRTALAVAGGLTAAGLGLVAAAGGRRRLLGALLLTGLVWAYDLKLKSTQAGTAAMAGVRTLDVLAGALAPGPGAVSTGAALRRAALPAALVGAHTYTLMALSRHEISGAPARLPVTTLAVSTATALATALPATARAGTADTGPTEKARTGLVPADALASLGAYGTAQARAAREPSGENVRRAVGAGILGLMPLQAAPTARAGSPVFAAALGVVHPLARRLARRISPT